MHTKGPWELIGLNEVYAVPSGELIAEVSYSAFAGMTESDIANAILISAAPDLLEALEDAASAIMSVDLHLFGYDPEIGYYYRDELMAKIDTAIAKSKGEL